jgi:predicted amino acid-binding ACT domain protein
MAVNISTVEVWAGDIRDQAGSLAGVLERVADSGASVDCVIARRHPDRAGEGDVFISTSKSRKQNGAESAGLAHADNLATIRVEGSDKQGLGAKMMRAIADTGVNVRGVSAMTMGGKFVAYIGFDNEEDAQRATAAIKSVSANGGRRRASTARRPSARRRARK